MQIDPPPEAIVALTLCVARFAAAIPRATAPGLNNVLQWRRHARVSIVMET
jgi:hypothetical protein